MSTLDVRTSGTRATAASEPGPGPGTRTGQDGHRPALGASALGLTTRVTRPTTHDPIGW